MTENRDRITAEARFALKTFYNYIMAYALEIGAIDKILEKQRQLRGFCSLQQGNRNASELRTPFFRGHLTLKAMAKLGEYPDIAVAAVHWAPVLSYYAVHGIGLAALISLHCTPPKSHQKFCSIVTTKIVKHLLPSPFNISCTSRRSWHPNTSPGMDNFDGDPCKISDLNQLSNPRYIPNKLMMVAKALTSTRKERLDHKIREKGKTGVRKGRQRRNLNKRDKDQVDADLWNTTVFDFLWRMRFRSNYESPDMYFFGLTEETAVTYYGNLLLVTRALCECLNAIVLTQIGDSEFEQLRPVLSR